MNFYIKRNTYDTGFEEIGRVQNLEESKEKDNEILEVLEKYKVPFSSALNSLICANVHIFLFIARLF